ncbi:MAG: transcriptional repressor [Elusimicrobiota bacterium]
MKQEEKTFEKYINEKGLKHSKQRNEILRVFINTEKHLTADELYRSVKNKYPEVGFATVYRTLKLLSECGLCREVVFGDGVARYEHKYGHEHHDHLVCVKCGNFVEVFEPRIEELQEKLAGKYGFLQKHHRMEIYGICRKCNRKGFPGRRQ